QQVDLDHERIYSASADDTLRIWDRYKGDCSHVLEAANSFSKISVTPSYIIATPRSASTLFIWDIVSGKLEHRIDNQWTWDLGPIRGKERTLSTIEIDQDPGVYWFRVWDLKSGQLRRTSSLEAGLERILFFRGGLFIGLAAEGEEYVLKVWDFSANYPLDGEVKNNDHGIPRDNVIDMTEEVGKDDCGMTVIPSPSSSAVEGALTGNSIIAAKRKRSATREPFPRRKREKNDEHDEQVSTSLS
ncbi:hypothetical protein CVT26_004450, partial [Gymnopilus dilepis]